MIAKHYSAVVFDMDGVIFDSETLCLKSFEVTAEKWKLAGIREVFLKCVGTNTEKTREIMFKAYGRDFDYDRFRDEAGAYFKAVEYSGGLLLKKGVVDLLQALKTADIPIGLASSTRQARVEEQLTNAGIIQYFTKIVGGDRLKKSKPEPDIYLLACEELGVDPKTALAIEDSYNGVRSAYAAQMSVAMVPDLLPAIPEVADKATYLVNNLTELQKLLFV